jgi:hypothetical protein
MIKTSFNAVEYDKSLDISEIERFKYMRLSFNSKNRIKIYMINII